MFTETDQERELEERIRSLCSSLELLLTYGHDLNGRHDTFGLLYSRLGRHGVTNPKQALAEFCSLYVEIKASHPKYLSLIAQKMKSTHIYSPAEKKMMEKLSTPEHLDAKPLSGIERQFMGILVALHLYNLRYEVYPQIYPHHAEHVF